MKMAADSERGPTRPYGVRVKEKKTVLNVRKTIGFEVWMFEETHRSDESYETRVRTCLLHCAHGNTSVHIRYEGDN